MTKRMPQNAVYTKMQDLYERLRSSGDTDGIRTIIELSSIVVSMEEELAKLKTETPVSPNGVKFFRYVRPETARLSGAFPGPMGTSTISSNEGITFRIILDYDARLIRFNFSVCNGDNFSKDYGRVIAAEAPQYSVPLPKGGVGDRGIVRGVIEPYLRMLVQSHDITTRNERNKINMALDQLNRAKR